MRIGTATSALLLVGLVGCQPPDSPAAPVEQAKPVQSEGLNEYERLEAAAFSGDYQAQRNLAYTLSTGIPHNQVLACAWRIVIVESGALEVDQSDVGNKAHDCDRKLDEVGLTAAKAQAETIKKKIAENTKPESAQ